jgi:hypothetical protein
MKRPSYRLSSSKLNSSRIRTLMKRKNWLKHSQKLPLIRQPRSQMMWSTDVMSVGEVNDEGIPLNTTVDTRLSRVCGLAARQRVLLILQGFDDLTENEKGELFKNSIQAYVQYLKELKQKGKKVAMKIISHAWRSYKSKLVKIWRNQDTPFRKYKDVTKKIGRDLLKSVNQSTLSWRVSTCSGSDRRTSLTTTLATPVTLENR